MEGKHKRLTKSLEIATHKVATRVEISDCRQSIWHSCGFQFQRQSRA